MRLLKTLQKPLTVGIILTVIVIAITGQRFLLTAKTYQGEAAYTQYNNFKIFSLSYFHLIKNKDLYKLYPDEHWDYYKYSPTFALLMAPFAHLPDFAGLLLWNLLNALILFYALWKLPLYSDRTKLFITGFILIELITSLQNSQSNGLIAGLIVLAFVLLENKKTGPASLCIVLTVFIKLFGAAAFVLFLFYPNKLKAAAYSAGLIVVFTLLPLMVIAPSQLYFLYQSWFQLLISDQDASYGLSVAGWLHSWFNIEFSKNIIVLFGLILLSVPLLKFKFFRDVKFRLLFLSSLLIWLVIFNHKAESPTYIIAITGVAAWFFSGKRKTEDTILIILAFIFTTLSHTNLFPKGLRDSYVTPYVLKAVPCILIWLKISVELIFYQRKAPIKVFQP
jgi:hypothetical protein